KNTASYLLQKKRYQAVYAISLRLAAQSLQQYQYASYENYGATDAAIHIRRINHQPVEFCNYVLLGIQQVLTEIFLIAFALTALAIVNGRLFLLLVPVIAPAVLLVLFIVKKRSKQVRTKIQEANSNSLQYLTEAVNGYVESNMYNSNVFFNNRYRNSLQLVNRHLTDMHLMQKAAPVIMELFGVAGLVFLIIQNQYTGSATNTVLLGAFIAAAYKIIPGIARIMSAGALIKTFAFTINDLPQLKNKTVTNNNATAHINTIRFDKVSFSYGEKRVIDALSFTAAKANVTALCGDSGTGKTTVINLLLGFIQQQQGDISFNSVAGNAAARKNYWLQTAYVKQQNFLLHASIKTNIILTGEDYDATRLNEAVEAAGLSTFLKTLPQGIDSGINQDGRNISGGQRQRIAIARALYKNADLLLLDEPFNELDEAAINALMDTFKAYAAKGKIVLLVTHNKAAAARCNEIVYIQ
ncbi:MAG: ABC transporter ATP-binding protein, partial [Bacteroidota bacterium]